MCVCMHVCINIRTYINQQHTYIVFISTYICGSSHPNYDARHAYILKNTDIGKYIYTYIGMYTYVHT